MSSHVKRNDKIGISVAIATGMVFGLYPAASRAAYADGANTTFVLFLTTVIRTFMLLAFCGLTKKTLFSCSDHRKAALSGGFWQAISTVGIIASLIYIQGPILLTILFSATVMLLFFMAWRGEIKLDFNTLFSTFLVFVGLVLVLDVWHTQSSAQWIGCGLAFVAAFAAMSRVYVYGHQMKTRNPAVVGAEGFTVALILMLPLAFWMSPVAPINYTGWCWGLLASLSLGVGSFGMFYGLALLGPFRWSLFLKVEPVFTSLFSVLFLGEYLKWYQYVGILLVVGSLVVYQLVSQRKKVASLVAAE